MPGRRSSSEIGVPASYPSRLILESCQRGASTSAVEPLDPKSSLSLEGSRRKQKRKQHSYEVSTIRSLARHYLRHPSGRNLPLGVDGLAGSVYWEIFQKVDPKNTIKGLQLFYGNQKFNELRRDGTRFLVTLVQGIWTGSRPDRLPIVEIQTSGWTERQRAYVWRELVIAQEEARKDHKRGGKRKAWFFFIGRQASANRFSYSCENHRLVCSLFEEFRVDT